MSRTFWAREWTRAGSMDPWHSAVYGFSSDLRRRLWLDAAATYRYDDWRREEARATDPDVRSISRSRDYDLWAASHYDPDHEADGSEPEPIGDEPAPFPAEEVHTGP